MKVSRKKQVLIRDAVHIILDGGGTKVGTGGTQRTWRKTACSLPSKFARKARRDNMAEHEVIANQKTILHNQAAILENQKTILSNQGTIERNQLALDQILANQKEILENQKMILAVAK
jgi:hypothetical protein